MNLNNAEALRLADAISKNNMTLNLECAAELRRLYWEELRVREHRDQMCAEVTRLHELNAELLEALKGVLAWGTDENWKNAEIWCEKARAAIAKAEGN